MDNVMEYIDFDNPPTIDDASSDENYVPNKKKTKKQRSCVTKSAPTRISSDREFIDSSPMAKSQFANVHLELATWVARCKIPGTHVDSLLKILHQHYDATLPCDHRTLCRTPKKADVEVFDDHGGKYKYFGLRTFLTSFLCTHWDVWKNRTLISLECNIDGVPLSNSSKLSLWRILANVTGFKEIHMIACYCGNSKPKDTQKYLREFCDELKEILANGLIVNGVSYKVSLNAFACDAPARADILNIYHHTARRPCHRCKITSSRFMNRQVFDTLESARRTSSEFRDKSDELHYHGSSAFDHLDIDVPKIFTIDYMHAVLLGVVKHLLQLWFLDRNQPYSITQENIRNLNELQQTIAKCFPGEFSRKLRSFDLLKRFKATELRSLLLYTLPILLKGKLDQKYYKHFLKLHCAIRMLCDSRTCVINIQTARVLITEFVASFPKLYHRQNATYNVHCLLHICEDVERIGQPLDSYSCFKFENYLQVLKNIPKNGHRVLEQISNKLAEQAHILKSTDKKLTDSSTFRIDVGLNSAVAYINGFMLSTISPNNFCLFNYEDIGLCRIDKIQANGFLTVRKVDNVKPLFENPINSRDLCSSVVAVTNNIETILSKDSFLIKPSLTTRKAIHMTFGNSHHFIELMN